MMSMMIGINMQHGMTRHVCLTTARHELGWLLGYSGIGPPLDGGRSLQEDLAFTLSYVMAHSKATSI